jgi:endonuclease/exonuclease/phosphatase family metal-dependent hydrolase
VITLAPAIVITLVAVVLGFTFGPGSHKPSPQQAAATTTGSPTAVHPAAITPAVTPRTDTERVLIAARKHLKAKAPPKPKFLVQPPFSFEIASFNVLGSSHTVKGGDRAAMADGRARTGMAVDALRSAGIDIVGFQELQTAQFDAFRARTGGSWDSWPGAAIDRLDVDNTLAWNTSVFRAVEKKTIPIPYFYGKTRNMPYVLLQHIATGQQIWVANFHNPAAKYGATQAQHRREATRREIALANQLAGSGFPVFITGDMNEREQYFCPVTQQTGLHSASGGSTGSACHPPSRMPVDWIFGSESVDFSNYAIAERGIVGRITDHPMIRATASVPERKVPVGSSPAH